MVEKGLDDKEISHSRSLASPIKKIKGIQIKKSYLTILILLIIIFSAGMYLQSTFGSKKFENQYLYVEYPHDWTISEYNYSTYNFSYTEIKLNKSYLDNKTPRSGTAEIKIRIINTEMTLEEYIEKSHENITNLNKTTFLGIPAYMQYQRSNYTDHVYNSAKRTYWLKRTDHIIKIMTKEPEQPSSVLQTIESILNSLELK